MPAYVIVETDVTDPERYEQYKAASPAAIAAGGGRFLVRGGDLAVLEGDWHPSRLVVLEFEDLAAAERWFESGVYQQVKKLARGCSALAHGRRAGRPVADRSPACAIRVLDALRGRVASCPHDGHSLVRRSG